jgi:glucosamine--fructose-6-phosphate aminotransferase (isomerizing)
MTETIECYQEIIGQKYAWEEAVQVCKQNKAQITEFLDIRKPSEIFFAGCTSPYYAGMCAAAFWRSETGMQAKAIPSSELVLYPATYYPNPTDNPILIALSRSGKTTETLLAVEEFNRRYPGRVIVIGCNPDSQLTRIAGLNILLPNSAENTIPQTRSLSAMFLSTLLITAYYTGQIEMIDALHQAPSKVDSILLDSDAKVKALIGEREFKNIFVLGSGPLYGMALEIGLKLMEMTNTDAFSYPFLESRHGPRSLIDENTLVIGMYSRGGLKYEAQLMDELTSKHGATTLAIIPQAGWETGRVSASISVDSDWPDGYLSLAYLPVGQLAAFYCAIAKGLNPDVARNHTPFVEIQRFDN